MCYWLALFSILVMFGFALFGALCAYWLVDEYRSEMRVRLRKDKR